MMTCRREMVFNVRGRIFPGFLVPLLLCAAGVAFNLHLARGAVMGREVQGAGQDASGIVRDIGEGRQETTDNKCLPVRDIPEDELAFREGERLEFSVRYKWGIIDSEVGVASATVAGTRGSDGSPLFHCVAQGRTSRFFDVFFKVRERFESWFRTDNMRPVSALRDTYEGGYEARNKYVWLRPGERIDADVYTTRLGDTSLVLPGTQCTFDLVSLFYFARNLDFDNYRMNVKYPISFAIDDDIYNLYFIILGREAVKIKGVGTFNTIKFAARMVAGEVFNGETDMFIWVTDDKNRVPVYFESPIKVGAVSGRITGFSGLKHPLSSKID